MIGPAKHCVRSKQTSETASSSVQDKQHDYFHSNSIPASLNMLSDSVVLLKSKVESMQVKLVTIREDKAGHSDSMGIYLIVNSSNSKLNRTVNYVVLLAELHLSHCRHSAPRKKTADVQQGCMNNERNSV